MWKEEVWLSYEAGICDRQRGAEGKCKGSVLVWDYVFAQFCSGRGRCRLTFHLGPRELIPYLLARPKHIAWLGCCDSAVVRWQGPVFAAGERDFPFSPGSGLVSDFTV